LTIKTISADEVIFMLLSPHLNLTKMSPYARHGLQQRKITMSEVLHTTDATFEQDVLRADVPVLLDFWAPWCGPCRMVAPILDELAAEFGAKVKVVKINIDENQETPAKFGVRSIPTLILFKEGKAAATQVGALPKNQLANFVNQNI